MKIAFVVNRFPALSETFILNQATGLLDRGHDVEIFAKSSRDEPFHPEIESYGLLRRTRYWPNLPRNHALRLIKGLGLLGREAIRRPGVAFRAANAMTYGLQALSLNLAYDVSVFRKPRTYDVIHCHFGDVGVRGMALRDMGLLNGKLVTSFHGFDLSRRIRHGPQSGLRAYRRLFARGDMFLPVSETWRRRLLELGCPSSRVTVHRMGIDCRQFAFRERVFPADGVLRLVSVGRLIEKKGFEYAIRAVSQIAKKRNLVYTVIGDGPLQRELDSLIRGFGLSGVVSLAGRMRQPEVVRALNEAHILLVPSVIASDGDQEGIPVVLMEAMAMGLPVIASRHSGVPELVEDGVSGTLVPERDVEALARAVEDLVNRHARWPSLGRAGRARVEHQHDIQRLVDSLLGIYDQVIASD